MAPKFKKDATADAIAAALASAQSASTGKTVNPLSTKDFQSAPFDNSTLGLKSSAGVVLPTKITVGQAIQSMMDSKNNGAVADAIKVQIAKDNPAAMKAAGVTSLSPTGSVTPKELAAITSVIQQGYLNNPTGSTLNLSNIISDIKTGTYAANATNIKSNINIKNFDQPNINATKSTVNNIFMDMLGRTASDAEINKYSTQYLNYADKNPTNVTTGQYKYGYINTPAGGNRLMRQDQQEQSVQNQLNEKDFIQNQVLGSTDYNTFAAANTAYGFLKNLATQSAGTE